MATLTKVKKPGLPAEQLSKLHDFAKKVLAGEIQPPTEKTAQARQNLRKAGLIE